MTTIYIYTTGPMSSLQKSALIEAVSNAVATSELPRAAGDITCVLTHEVPGGRRAVWSVALIAGYLARHMAKREPPKTDEGTSAHDDAVDRMRAHWSPDPSRSRRGHHSH